MISVSLSDIILAMKVEEDLNYNEIELLSKETDDLVLQYAHSFGLDDKQGYAFIYNRHRNLQNQVVDGFRIIGEIRKDRAFINSPFCTTEDRAIGLADKDIGLAKELFGMMGAKVTYGSLKGEDVDEDGDMPEASYLEADYDSVLNTINTYNQICHDIRGTAYNEYGNLKNYQEWKSN